MNPPTFGYKAQFAALQDLFAILPHNDKLLIQQVVGSLLYYALAVDCTLLVALGEIDPNQSLLIKDTMKTSTWLLNYVAFNPNSIITYATSAMCLHIHGDTSYLSVPKARNRAGSHFS